MKMKQNNLYFICEKLEKTVSMYLNVDFINKKSSVFKVLLSCHFFLFNFGCGDYMRGVWVWQNKPKKGNTGLMFYRQESFIYNVKNKNNCQSYISWDFKIYFLIRLKVVRENANILISKSHFLSGRSTNHCS